MTQIINTADLAIEQSLACLPLLYPQLELLPGTGIITYRGQDNQSIPILSGGGSGHEPAHAGYVGQGMLTGAVAGSLFQPPKSEEILRAIHKLHQGKGVFLIVKNFEADLAEFGRAIQIARKEEIPIKYIVSHDDISIDSPHFQVRHRGVAGTILLHKILGEAARQGASLEQLEAIGLELSTNIATLGVATRSATLPGQEEPIFDLLEKHISFGIGIHGEAGYKTEPFQSSEQLAIELVNKLKLKFHWKEKERYILLINNLGATSKMEELIFTNDVLQLLELEGLQIPFIKTGHLITSLDMAGLSVTLCPIKQDFWLDYLQAETDAFAW